MAVTQTLNPSILMIKLVAGLGRLFERALLGNLEARQWTILIPLVVLVGSSLSLCLRGSEIAEPVILTWNDNSSNEDGFRIERSSDNIEFVEIAVVGENVTTYTDNDSLEAGQTYAYRVRAFNEFGNSGYTNTRTTYYDPPPQFFFGELGTDGGSFAIMCRADGSAVFLGTTESDATTTLIQEFQVGNDGLFEFLVLEFGSFSGQIIDGQIYGSIDTSSASSGGMSIASSDLLLSGSVAESNGGTASFAGFYDSGIDPETGTRLIVLAGPDGSGFVVSSFGSTNSGGKLDLSVDATSLASLDDGTMVSVGFAEMEGFLSGTVTRNGETFDFLGQDESARNKSVFLNASMRSQIEGRSTIVAGFVVSGVGEKRLLIRGVGPSLAALGVPNPVEDPKLKLYRFGESEAVVENDNWGTGNVPSIQEIGTSVGAFPLLLDSGDAAIVVSAEPGLYWLHVTNQAARTGTALVEIYDLDEGSTSSSLVNLSLRGKVTSGSDPLIAGFVIGGNAAKGIMVRAMGQELQGLGVSNTLADPVLKMYGSGDMQGLFAENTNWLNDADLLREIAIDVGAFEFERGSRSAAKAMWLNAGLYTAVVGDRSTSSGEVLVEFYGIP